MIANVRNNTVHRLLSLAAAILGIEHRLCAIVWATCCSQAGGAAVPGDFCAGRQQCGGGLYARGNRGALHLHLGLELTGWQGVNNGGMHTAAALQACLPAVHTVQLMPPNRASLLHASDPRHRAQAAAGVAARRGGAGADATRHQHPHHSRTGAAASAAVALLQLRCSRAVAAVPFVSWRCCPYACSDAPPPSLVHFPDTCS